MIKKIIIVWIYFLFVGTNVDSFSFPDSKPVGFPWNDALYTLDGKADLFLVDEQWRSSGYKNRHTVEEIPWVSPLITFGWSSEDRKQVYMSERKDLKSVIVGTTKEEYTLMIAGGNYYLKIEWIPTKKWQVDEIISREDSIEINFDNDKNGTYSLIMDHYKYENGTIFYPLKTANGDIQNYTINWEWVVNKQQDSVKYTTKIDLEEKDNKYDLWWHKDEVIPVNKSYKENIQLGLYILAILSFVLLAIIFYKKRITKKRLFIIWFIICCLFLRIQVLIHKNELDCVSLWFTVKEPWLEFDGKWPYEVKWGKVYIKESIWSTLNYNLKTTEINIESFKVISRWYSRDDKNIYYWGKKIESAEYCSFEVSSLWNSSEMSQWFAKDKNNVYLYGKIFKWADAKTFQREGSNFFIDKSKVYNTNGDVVKWVDIKTFTYDDKKYFNYDINGVYIDENIQIIWSDWATFEKIGWYLYKDKNHVYYKSNILEWADSLTFEKISYEYYKDKNNIYLYTWKVLEGIDRDSYGHTQLNSVIYDKKWVFADHDIYIPWADWESFLVLQYWYYKDKDSVYYKTKNDEKDMSNVDISTFKVIKRWSWYAVDKDKVYFNWELIKESTNTGICTTYRDCSNAFPIIK